MVEVEPPQWSPPLTASRQARLRVRVLVQCRMMNIIWSSKAARSASAQISLHITPHWLDSSSNNPRDNLHVLLLPHLMAHLRRAARCALFCKGTGQGVDRASLAYWVARLRSGRLQAVQAKHGWARASEPPSHRKAAWPASVCWASGQWGDGHTIVFGGNLSLGV